MYRNEIAATIDAGIFRGSNGYFLPENHLTREQLATVLVNAYGLEGTAPHKEINLTGVHPSHQKNVQILADLEITNQLEDFRPKETVTRGQFATFLYRVQHMNQDN